MLCMTYTTKLLAFKNCKSLVYCYISEVAVSSLPCLNQISFTFPLLASQAICHPLNTGPTLSPGGGGVGAGKPKSAPVSDEKKQRRKLADNQQKSEDQQEAKSLEQEPFSTFPGQSRRTAAVERSGVETTTTWLGFQVFTQTFPSVLFLSFEIKCVFIVNNKKTL